MARMGGSYVKGQNGKTRMIERTRPHPDGAGPRPARKVAGKPAGKPARKQK